MFSSFLQDGVEREYYAVFDGHGGVDAATYSSTHLHVILSQQAVLKSDPSTAFKKSFIQTDDMFRIKARREVRASEGEETELYFMITPCITLGCSSYIGIKTIYVS